MGSRAFSRPGRIGLLVAGLVAMGILAAAGCAGRGRGAPRPEIGAQGGAGQREAPAVGAGGGSGSKEAEDRGEERSAGTIVLPGQNRLLPSQDPRNLAGSGELAPAGEGPAVAAPAVAAPPIVPGDVEGNEAPASPARESAKTDSQAPSSFLPPPIPPGEDRFRVQVLASAIPANASRVRGELEETLGLPVYVEQEQGILKVRVGDFRDRAAADTLRRRLFGLGYGDAFVVECRGR